MYTVLSIKIASLSCSKPDDLKYEAMAISEQSVMDFKSLEGWKKKETENSLIYWPGDPLLAILLQLKCISLM